MQSTQDPAYILCASAEIARTVSIRPRYYPLLASAEIASCSAQSSIWHCSNYNIPRIILKEKINHFCFKIVDYAPRE